MIKARWTRAKRFVFPMLRLCTIGFAVLTIRCGLAAEGHGASAVVPFNGGIVMNPQAGYGFLGNDFLGCALGLGESTGLRLGGFLIPELDWVASGGLKPGSSFGSGALGLHVSADTEKILKIPGGRLGIELLASSNGAGINEAAGSVQRFTNLEAGEPRDRVQIMQLWWRQFLFDNKLIIQLGKMNGSGIFNTVTNPVIVNEPQLRDAGINISNLIYVPVGLNPTLFGRLPAYPETAYGAVATFAPTTNFYVSGGIFDGNGANGWQTGWKSLPKFNDYTFRIGEVGYSWRLGNLGMPGRIGVGAWRQTGDLYTPALSVENGASGYYAFANQRLWYRRPNLDSSGLVGYLQYGHTGSQAAQVNTYFGAGLTGAGLIPGRPQDTVSLGIARSTLNTSMGLAPSELMLQAAYTANFTIGTPANYWTFTAIAAYTYIPTPGQRPDLPAADVFSLRLVTLF